MQAVRAYALAGRRRAERWASCSVFVRRAESLCDDVAPCRTRAQQHAACFAPLWRRLPLPGTVIVCVMANRSHTTVRTSTVHARKMAVHATHVHRESSMLEQARVRSFSRSTCDPLAVRMRSREHRVGRDPKGTRWLSQGLPRGGVHGTFQLYSYQQQQHTSCVGSLAHTPPCYALQSW